MSVTREEILVLGLTAGVVGSLVGGLMLGVGLGLAVQGASIGWLLVCRRRPWPGCWAMCWREAGQKALTLGAS